MDESPITGESLPVQRDEGEQVFAGSVLGDGFLEVESNRPWSDTTLQRIVRMVQDAESRRAPVERFVDRFARWYTPAVVVLAVLMVVGPTLLGGAPFRTRFVRGLTLLVIACPCALVISTPVSVVSAITAAARNGVLIKGGEYLEALGSIRAVAFDKTGTLTGGRPKLVEVRVLEARRGGLSAGGSAEEGRFQMLRVAAALENRSAHPLASAVVEAWDEETGEIAPGLNGAGLPDISDFQHLAGRGVEGTVQGEGYRLGRPVLFDLEPGEDALIGTLEREGRTVSVLGTAGGVPLALLAFSDVPRTEARETVSRLRAGRTQIVAMLTGDNERTAAAVGAEVGIDLIFAGLLPEEKVLVIERLQSEHGGVAMVGDGVNDAPALARADVGIAMGAAGSDTALETCDVALMADDLRQLPYALDLSRRAGRVIRQNIAVSLFLKFALALGVVPGFVSLITAVLVGDMGASLAVTLNAMRLARDR